MSTVIKTMWHGRRDKHITQWHKIENPETESPKYGRLILTKLQSSFVDWLKVKNAGSDLPSFLEWR